MTPGLCVKPSRAISLLSGLLLPFAFSLLAPPALTAHSLFVSVGQANATVTLDSLELGLTDDSGVLFSQPVSQGRHFLRIEKEGYRTVRDTIDLPAELTYNHTRPLEPLRVIVLNQSTGLEVDSVAGPYTIQAGSFREEPNARKLADSFRGTAYASRIETAEVSRLGEVHRVRLSLFNSLAEARQAAGRIAGISGQDVWIVGLDGRDWAVQLGAFSRRGEAEKLAARLDGTGIYLWVEDSADGLFRVKAGYWPDRESAAAAVQRFSSVTGARPMIVQVR